MFNNSTFVLYSKPNGINNKLIFSVNSLAWKYSLRKIYKKTSCVKLKIVTKLRSMSRKSISADRNF